MFLNFNKLKINNENIGFFKFKKLGNEYLLTNDVTYTNLKEEDFKNFLEDKLDKESEIFKELASKGFIKNHFPTNNIIKRYCDRYHFLLNRGVGLHIIVVTKRCNHLCVYCQAGRAEFQNEKYDMNEETAKKTVDLIFQTPAKSFTIEFQGGEPLLNWKIIKFIVEYAKTKNEIFKKRLNFSLVTNLSLMTDDKYKYLIDNNINICTSLDGPKDVHNKNRPFFNKEGTYDKVVFWIEKMRKNEKENSLKRVLSALPTLTKYSLENIKEVIDEYIKHNFNVIHLRQLSFLGCSSGEENKEKFGYTAQEFIDAWIKGMDYIIEKNKEGIDIKERGAMIFLQKIIKEIDSNFLDLRSPCGAGIGQLAYFHDGNVYCCDEGRMVGNDLFMLGNVFKSKYEDIAEADQTKTLVTASTLDNFACDECVYKTYCGTCPVLNYVLYNNLFPNIRATDKCKIHEAMLDYLFLKIKNEEVFKIFKNWIKDK